MKDFISKDNKIFINRLEDFLVDIVIQAYSVQRLFIVIRSMNSRQASKISNFKSNESSTFLCFLLMVHKTVLDLSKRRFLTYIYISSVKLPQSVKFLTVLN